MEIYDEARLSPCDPDYLARIPLLSGRFLGKSTYTLPQTHRVDPTEVLQIQPAGGGPAFWRLANGSGIRLGSDDEPLPIDDSVYQAQPLSLFGVDWIVTESGQSGPLV